MVKLVLDTFKPLKERKTGSDTTNSYKHPINSLYQN